MATSDLCNDGETADATKVTDLENFAINGIFILAMFLLTHIVVWLARAGLSAEEISTSIFVKIFKGLWIVLILILTAVEAHHTLMDEDIWLYIIGSFAFFMLFVTTSFVIWRYDLKITTTIILIFMVLVSFYKWSAICVPRNCNKIMDEDECNDIGEICMDTSKLLSECGSCSNSETLLEEECSGENDVWTSQLSSCYWVKGKEKVQDAPPAECINDLNKCDTINCDTYKATQLFGECCKIDNWEKWMDETTLKIIQNRTKKDAKRLDKKYDPSKVTQAELAAEYNLRRSSSEEYSRRDEMEQGIYA